jgi:hypothetical protein
MRNGTMSEKKLGFRIHAIVFVPGMVALLILNLLIGAPYWVQWVLLGWGIGLFSHWFFVLGPAPAGPKQPDRPRS